MKKIMFFLALPAAVLLLGASCQPADRGSNGAADGSASQEAGGEYAMLYSTYENDVSQGASVPGSEPCYNFTLSGCLQGGIVDRDGQNQESLAVEPYYMGQIASKKYGDYYYVSSQDPPFSEQFGMRIIDLNMPEQTVFGAAFRDKEGSALLSSSESRFPGYIKATPDNEYLLFTMTDKKGDAVMERASFQDAFLRDSDLMVRDLASGEDRKLIENDYNRQLFKSMSDISSDGKFLFTVRRNQDSFEFVRVNLTDGAVQPFSEVFPDFDWSRVPWDELFPQDTEQSFRPALMSLSPDETRLVMARSVMELDLQNMCSQSYKHKLWLLSIPENRMEIASDEAHLIDGLSWSPDSSAVAMMVVSGGGCYPQYLDSYVWTMGRESGDRQTLAEEPQSKMNAVIWSPDGKEIGYSVYGTDCVGKLKTVTPVLGEVKTVLTTEDTGQAGREDPVEFTFSDWVLK